MKLNEYLIRYCSETGGLRKKKLGAAGWRFSLVGPTFVLVFYLVLPYGCSLVDAHRLATA